MKKSIYIILVFALFTNAFGQKPTIELTLTATSNGQYVPLDSILIQNLTHGGDTTLFAPDAVLVLNYSLGIPGIDGAGKSTFTLSQNFPNPFREETTIQLYLPKNDHVKISAYNFIGQEVVFYENTLSKGNHSFTFHAGKENYYLITATNGYATSSIKMINLGKNSKLQAKLVYQEHDADIFSLKSQKAVNSFPFTPGDQLRFIGYAGTPAGITGSDVFENAPQSSTTYNFAIIEGVPCPGTPNISYEGQTYKTVQIGSQCWFKENLNIGSMINGSSNQTNNNEIEKYCYNNEQANCATYGGLYQWDEMMQYTTQQGVQGICPPTGRWHIPTKTEWCILMQFIDPTVDCSLEGWTGTDVGTKMKSTTGWNMGISGTNVSGFNAFSSGLRYSGGFSSLGDYTAFWSSKDYEDYAQTQGLEFDFAKVLLWNYTKEQGLSVRCVKNQTNLHAITTSEIINITQTTATGGGEITDNGGTTVTARGVCWSELQNPTIADSHTSNGTGSGSFESNLSDLNSNTLYFVRAYASNSEGTGYGNEVNFTTQSSSGGGEPCPGIPTVTYEGQTYNTVQIGDQCWFKENLNYEAGNSWCYDNNPANCDIYGRLYDWETSLCVCPSGWHLPSDNEWKILEGTADSQYGVGNPEWDGTGGRGFDAGLNLKSTSGWVNNNGNGTDQYGFSALPGGNRDFNGYFNSLGSASYWWSSSEYSGTIAWFRCLFYGYDGSNRVISYDNSETFEFSVRCLKDNVRTGD